MRPVCVGCQVEMRCDRNGVAVLEMVHVAAGSPEAYRLWHADRWRCEGCGHQIVTGFGAQPLAFVHEDQFAAALAAEEQVLRVYDRVEDVPYFSYPGPLTRSRS